MRGGWRWAIGILVLGGLCLLALTRFVERSGTSLGAVAPAPPEARLPAPGDRRAPESIAAPEGDQATREALREATAGTGADPEAASAAVDLTLEFVDPVRETLRIERGVLRATWSGGERSVEVRDAESVLLPGLPAVEVEVTLAAPGLRHVPQTFQLRADQPEATERLYLWPEGWIAVVVRDERGRPFTALASDLGLEPKRWFVGAFGARTRRAPPTPGDDAADADPPSRFEPPRAWQEYELPGSVVGGLRRFDPAPHWVGLEVFGLPLAWEHLPAGAERITFTLRQADLDARFAWLGLRVVEPGSSPIPDARVTLKADTSAHRRREQSKVATDSDGRVEFERVVPGDYELLTETDHAMDQRRLTLAAGERHDLGDIVLSSGVPIRVRVVDEQAQPCMAWIEVAPFVAGGRADELYPPNLHRHTQPDGTYLLQLPAAPTLVRATGLDPATWHANGEHSRNVVVDPARAPQGELELVLPRARVLTVTSGDPLAASVELVDETGIVVAARPLSEQSGATLRVAPGRYSARLLDGRGLELGLRVVELHEAEVALTLP